MFQSRKVRLKLNQRQKELVTKNFGASRFIWNWGLEQLNKWWEENKDLDKAERTKRPTVFDLRGKFTKLKTTEEFAWLKESDSMVANHTLNALEKAFRSFWKRMTKPPKFKSKKTSKRRAKAHLRLTRRYKRVANQHKDFLHKMTIKLVRENQTIRMEDLNTKGMMKNRNLAKAVGQQSFYEIKRQLEYKCLWHDREFQVVDRFFPSSQLCSKCGARNKAMKNLSKRHFICPECGFTLDRDLNAAINICTVGNTGTHARRDWSSVKEGKSLCSHSQSLKREL